MNKEHIIKLINRNKNIITEARQALDTVTAVALAGAATDKKARDLISTGTFTTISSGLVLGGLSITGLTGPIVLGVALAPTLAQISMISGLTSLLAGFIRGFRVGVVKSELIRQQVKVDLDKFKNSMAILTA